VEFKEVRVGWGVKKLSVGGGKVRKTKRLTLKYPSYLGRGWLSGVGLGPDEVKGYLSLFSINDSSSGGKAANAGRKQWWF